MITAIMPLPMIIFRHVFLPTFPVNGSFLALFPHFNMPIPVPLHCTLRLSVIVPFVVCISLFPLCIIRIAAHPIDMSVWGVVKGVDSRSKHIVAITWQDQTESTYVGLNFMSSTSFSVRIVNATVLICSLCLLALQCLLICPVLPQFQHLSLFLFVAG